MKKIGLLTLLFVIVSSATSFVINEKKEDSIKWYSWEEAVALNQENPKKIFVDVYTEWCGWCKKMDNSTFKDKEVVKYMNEHFYPVKFDAEQKEDVNFQGNTLKYKPDAGRRGVHDLASALLNGKMSYPSYVYMSPSYERITISPGYKDATALMKELKFIDKELYLTTTWQEYIDSLEEK